MTEHATLLWRPDARYTQTLPWASLDRSGGLQKRLLTCAANTRSHVASAADKQSWRLYPEGAVSSPVALLLSEMPPSPALLPHSQWPDSHGHSKIYCRHLLFGNFFLHHSNFCSIEHSFSPLNLITSCGHYLSFFYITCSLYQNIYFFKIRALLHLYSPDVS